MDTKQKSYKCRLCGQSFYSQEALNQHNRAAHGKNAISTDGFNCDNCGISFSSEKELQKHAYEEHAPISKKASMQAKKLRQKIR